MIARVFPTKTSMSPTDQDAYFDAPDIFTPQYDEVHVSVTFTWDIPKAQWLARQWEDKGKVKIGGVAIDGESYLPFKAGVYLRQGITITSRGCPNGCDFCIVKNKLKEFDDFPEGNIIQDNNFLACSKDHQEKVFKMLRFQKNIEFKGGLEARRVTQEVAEKFRSLRIKSLWLACDTANAIKPLKAAVEIFTKAGFTRNHLFCFCLIGKNIIEERSRLQEIWDIGCMPFAQLYQPKEKIAYSQEYRKLQREWSRPAITRNIATKSTLSHP